MSGTSNFAGYNFGYDSDKIFKYREENMCEKWRGCAEGRFLLCNINGYTDEKGNYLFRGNLKNFLKNLGMNQQIYVKYWASAPPTRGYSFSGSALPFPNENVAFDENKNHGASLIGGGRSEFSFNVEYPNSYYSQMGKKLNPPLVKFQFCDGEGNDITRVYTVKLGEPVPFRSLSFTKKRNWEEGPFFYTNSRMPLCRNQNQILMASKYPEKTMKEPNNFWGLAPPR